MTDTTREPRILLKGLAIRDFFGVERIPLDGSFTASELAKYLAGEWIPYVECIRDCSRSDYCKHVYSKGGVRNPHVEIRCGVCVEVLRLFVETSFESLCSWSHREQQAFFDAAYYLTSFVGEAEFAIGFGSCRSTVRYWENLGPYIFTRVVRFRDTLDRLASCLKEIPQMESRRSVLLVEGKSEMAFLRKLKESHLARFLDLLVDSYYGKDNKRPGRIAMLLRKYEEDGYLVHIQGDADGKEPGHIFADLVSKQLVKENQTFLFEYDFETSIAPGLLHHSLQRLGLLKSVSVESFRSLREAHGSSVVNLLRNSYQIEIDRVKVNLAEAVADTLNSVNWWSNEEFLKTELGRFLKFVREIP